VQAGGKILGPAPLRTAGRKPAEREDGSIFSGHRVRAEPGAPELNKARIRPGFGRRACDPGMQREDGCSGHAVLKAGQRRAPHRCRARWHPPDQSIGISTMGQDLLP